MAGEDISVTLVDTIVGLDGSASSDPDGDAISFSWSFDSAPSGSTATLTNANTATPNFKVDAYGEYVVRLTVTDSKGASAEDTVTVSFINLPPLADAGGNDSGVVANAVTLDGSDSSDPNNDPITFSWAIASSPDGSSAALVSSNTATPSFTPDVPGTYVIELTVSDGLLTDTDESSIEVISLQNATAGALAGTVTAIKVMSDASIKNKQMKKALTNKINAVLKNLEDGDYASALEKLQDDILSKTDGCANGGSPDKNDWIRVCADQDKVYPIVVSAIDYLKLLLP